MSVTKRNRVSLLHSRFQCREGRHARKWPRSRVGLIQDHEHLRGIKFEKRLVSFMHLFLESSFHSYFSPHRICSGIFFI